MINKCIRVLLIFTAYFVTSFAKCSDFDDRTKYAIPDPKIEVFSQGFRVSIPDQEGINLFAFHGNINVPMDDLEAGQFSKDILKKEDNHWVFEETKTELKVGDVIYYWLFVIRYNLGYRYDNHKFVVKEIVPCTPLKTDSKRKPAPSVAPNTTNNWYFEPLDKLAPVFSSNPKLNQTNSSSVSDSRNQQNLIVPTDRRPMSTCCQLFLNTSSQIALLSDQIDKLTEENKVLSEIAEKDEHYSRTLRVFGKYPTEYYPTPQDFIQYLISEKLRLEGVKVLEAKTIPENGVSFKVTTVTDKVNIILAAREKLQGSNYELSW